MKSPKKEFTAALILYWISLCILTHIPIKGWAGSIMYIDKIMHLIAFTILTLLVWLASSCDVKVNFRTPRPWIVCLIIVLYGIADEFTQQYIAGRSCDFSDFCFDVMGIILGMTAAVVISRKFIKSV